MDAAALFHRPAGPYFLSHSVGLRPLGADRTLGEGFVDPWAAGEATTWERWLETIDAWRAALGRLLGADAADLCPQTNISSALTKIIFSLPPRGGRRKIVLSEEDFPTIGFVASEARRLGWETVLLPAGAALADVDAWSPAFADDVAVVIATHVYSNSSRITPVEDIVRRARVAGVVSVLDLAQSAGCVPVDLSRLRPDFAVGTSIKYLCGGPGAAFLYADSDMARACAPLDVGWFSHEAPFEFDIRNFRYADRALRFWGGTPSVAPFAAARAGLDALAAYGVEAIRARSAALIRRLVEALGPDAFLSEIRPERHGSSAILRLRDGGEALAARGIRHDRRLGGARVSVHLYTQDADIDALIAACAEG